MNARSLFRSPLSVVTATALSAQCLAASASLVPVADTFVDGALSSNNYGAAGALGVSAPGLPQGEFQSVMRFDLSTAVAQFNTTFGTGNWSISGLSLKLTATAPNNAIFNQPAAGQFAVRWIANDAWPEGAGTPNAPTTSGVTFSTLPSFLGPNDEAVSTLSFAGGTSGSQTYALSLTPNLQSDILSGGLVSLQLLAADTTVSYLFNSRNFGTADARPTLTITATPEPGTMSALVLGGWLLSRRQRR